MGLAFATLVFALGASVGSFLNVVIYRVPLGVSVARPASRCPACETPIRLRHNVPVLGWLLLRGRCAACSAPISARYPLIELATGLLALALFVDLVGGPVDAARLADPRFTLDVLVPFVLYLTFVGVLIACTFIDLDWFILPDGLTLAPLPLGVLAALASGAAIGVTWQDALIGAAAGGAVVLVIIFVYGALTGRDGMGGGDWKLLALIGAWLGYQGLPFVLFAASVQGLAFAVIFRRSFAVAELPPDPLDVASLPAPSAPPASSSPAEPVPFRQLAVPFGPFLALAAVEYLFFRDELRELFRLAAGGR